MSCQTVAVDSLETFLPCARVTLFAGGGRRGVRSSAGCDEMATIKWNAIDCCVLSAETHA